MNSEFNKEELKIRRLGPLDLEAVLEIEKSSFALPWSREAYENELTRDHLAHFIGCFYQGRMLAFAGYWLLLDEGHIANVAVHPDFRRQGLGELIMTHLITLCKSQGGRKMTLEVRKSNTSAQNIYRRLGFEDAGLRPGYYTDNNEDALIMWANIAAPAARNGEWRMENGE